MAHRRLGSSRRVVKYDEEAVKFVVQKKEIAQIPRKLKKGFEHTIIEKGKAVEACFTTKFFALLDTAELQSNKGDKEATAATVLSAIDELNESFADTCRGFLNSRRLVGGFLSLICSDETLASGFDGQEPEAAISYRAWQKLCDYNPRWKTASHVKCHTYPALSPWSVSKCRLVVWITDEVIVETKSISTISDNLPPELLARLEALKTEEVEAEPLSFPILEPVFFNPLLLKKAGRDCDGDSIQFIAYRWGTPLFRKRINALPEAAKSDEVEEKFWAEMNVKCNERLTNRPPLKSFYIKERATEELIGQLTNCLDWASYQLAKENGNYVDGVRKMCEQFFEKHVETTFDQRKPGSDEIADTKTFVSNLGKAINTARKQGNLYAILNCGKKNDGFADVIDQYPTWDSVLVAMFGKTRTKKVEQDEIQVLPVVNEERCVE